MADLDPIRGHEQGGRRPALIVSTDRFNDSRAQLVVALPLTTKSLGLRYHVRLRPPEGGVTRPCHIKCEDVRCVSLERFTAFVGRIEATTMAEVEERLRMLLEL
ncbi:MAG: type II toxin-antitoxin system PemK/MazF family toxin [Armatimonadetes bacterium]|nr:type II toxin-antitoxin system PemK/MazF family toxin [Armatimonadota bacterium]